MFVHIGKIFMVDPDCFFSLAKLGYSYVCMVLYKSDAHHRRHRHQYTAR